MKLNNIEIKFINLIYKTLKRLSAKRCGVKKTPNSDEIWRCDFRTDRPVSVRPT